MRKYLANAKVGKVGELLITRMRGFERGLILHEQQGAAIIQVARVNYSQGASVKRVDRSLSSVFITVLYRCYEEIARG